MKNRVSWKNVFVGALAAIALLIVTATQATATANGATKNNEVTAAASIAKIANSDALQNVDQALPAMAAKMTLSKDTTSTVKNKAQAAASTTVTINDDSALAPDDVGTLAKNQAVTLSASTQARAANNQIRLSVRC